MNALHPLNAWPMRPAAPAHASTSLTQRGLQGYQRVSIEAQVATASPHHLITLLYQRLQRHIAEAEFAATQHNSAKRLRATESALAILDGLDTVLQPAAENKVAACLHDVYELVRAQLLDGSPACLSIARSSVSEVAAAWLTIKS